MWIQVGLGTVILISKISTAVSAKTMEDGKQRSLSVEDWKKRTTHFISIAFQLTRGFGQFLNLRVLVHEPIHHPKPILIPKPIVLATPEVQSPKLEKFGIAAILQCLNGDEKSFLGSFSKIEASTIQVAETMAAIFGLVELKKLGLQGENMELCTDCDYVSNRTDRFAYYTNIHNVNEAYLSFKAEFSNLVVSHVFSEGNIARSLANHGRLLGSKYPGHHLDFYRGHARGHGAGLPNFVLRYANATFKHPSCPEKPSKQREWEIERIKGLVGR